MTKCRNKLLAILTLGAVSLTIACTRVDQGINATGFVRLSMVEDDNVAIHPYDTWRDSSQLHLRLIVESLKNYKNIEITCWTMRDGVYIEGSAVSAGDYSVGDRAFVNVNLPWGDPKPNMTKCFTSKTEEKQ